MSLVLNVEILGEFKKLTQATKGAENQLTKLNKTTQSIGNKMNGTLAAIGVGFSLNAVIRGIGDTLESASDLEQQFGALDSIFKDISPTMQDFARSLSPIGLSAADASRSMALLGSQLKGYGLPVDEAAQKTQELTLLAADLAATFGGTTYGAVESISALFRGEYDPIEKYGVAIKKSDVNARLAAEGLGELEGEALKMAEAQAALTLLFEKTTDAQGQAARESESYAAQQAYLRAESENLKAEIGEALLPVMIELFKAIRDDLPQIKEFVRTLVDFIPFVVDLAIKALEFKEAVTGITLALTAMKLGVNLVTAAMSPMMLSFANPYFLGAALVLGGIAAGMYEVYTNTNKANNALNEFNRLEAVKRSMTTVQAPIQTQTGALQGLIPQLAPVAPPVPAKPGAARTTQSTTSTSPTVNININRATVDTDTIVNEINSKLKSQGSAVILR